MSIKYFRLLWIKLQIENRRFMKFLDSLNENEPYNIVDVSTDKVKVLIKSR